MNLKNISIFFGVIIFLVGTFMGLAEIKGKVVEKVETVEKSVAKVEDKTEKTDEALTENEKIDLTQSVLIEQITKALERIDKKLDKEGN